MLSRFRRQQIEDILSLMVKRNVLMCQYEILL